MLLLGALGASLSSAVWVGPADLRVPGVALRAGRDRDAAVTPDAGLTPRARALLDGA